MDQWGDGLAPGIEKVQKKVAMDQKHWTHMAPRNGEGDKLPRSKQNKEKQPSKPRATTTDRKSATHDKTSPRHGRDDTQKSSSSPRNPQESSKSVTNGEIMQKTKLSISKSKRPDVQVYVPRAKRLECDNEVPEAQEKEPKTPEEAVIEPVEKPAKSRQTKKVRPSMEPYVPKCRRVDPTVSQEETSTKESLENSKGDNIATHHEDQTDAAKVESNNKITTPEKDTHKSKAKKPKCKNTDGDVMNSTDAKHDDESSPRSSKHEKKQKHRAKHKKSTDQSDLAVSPSQIHDAQNNLNDSTPKTANHKDIMADDPAIIDRSDLVTPLTPSENVLPACDNTLEYVPDSVSINSNDTNVDHDAHKTSVLHENSVLPRDHCDQPSNSCHSTRDVDTVSSGVAASNMLADENKCQERAAETDMECDDLSFCPSHDECLDIITGACVSKFQTKPRILAAHDTNRNQPGPSYQEPLSETNRNQSEQTTQKFVEKPLLPQSHARTHPVEHESDQIRMGTDVRSDIENHCRKSPKRPKDVKLDDSVPEDDEDSWDKMFDDTGEALNPTQLEELTAAVGKVEIQKTQFDYYNYQPKDPDIDYASYGHLIEIYDFPTTLITRDLIMAFREFQDAGFDIKWVDDSHAIGIFSSSFAARSALTLRHPLIKVRPLSESTRQTKMKAKRTCEFLQPYKQRPETVASVARNMVAGALGIRSNVTKEKRDEERKKLREAKEKKRQASRQKKDAWDGSFGRCAMDED